MHTLKIYKKDDLVKVTIEDMSAAGEGIGKIDGYPVFIKDTVVGDVVEAKMMKTKKSYGYGRLMQILEPSPQRVEPVCPVARRCGGCQLQQMSYEAQLKFKEKLVRNNLLRIGGIEDYEMPPIFGMDNPYHYRNKAQYPVGLDKEGKRVIGFYAGRTHSIIPHQDCCIGAPCNEKILEIIQQYMDKNQVEPYDEASHQGRLRHVLIRSGFATGQIMVCLILNGSRLPQEHELVQSLLALEGMTSIMVNENREKTNVILGSKVRVLWGKPYIEDCIGDIRFRISPLSFFQVNPVQTRILYEKALEFAGLTGKETVWDLYCGIGTISLFLAKHARRVCGVEIIPQAVDDARENARINGIENVEFFAGRAEDVVPAYYKNTVASGPDGAQEMAHPDVMVVDPPRKGCDLALLETMAVMAPQRIVYVSCDSATLARDLKFLKEKGYIVKKAVCVDMFPGTVHVETVVLLSQQKPGDVIRVELDLDELEVTPAESKATYGEIKAYVWENFGLKVSSLYISQVKRKCGLEVGENYNLPKSENAKVPTCLPEKEKAIMAALEHFQMIEGSGRK